MSKERDLLEKMVGANGDTDVLIMLIGKAKELLQEEADLEYYRHELVVGLAASLRTATAIETLLKEFDKRYPEISKKLDNDNYSLSA